MKFRKNPCELHKSIQTHLSPQDLDTYQLSNHDNFSELFIKQWQITDGIIQDKVVITEDEINQLKEHNINRLEVLNY